MRVSPDSTTSEAKSNQSYPTRDKINTQRSARILTNLREKMKKALITGINGQDGSYLAELLLSRGYEVHGTKRRSSTVTTGRLDGLKKSVTGTDLDFSIQLHHADVTDSSSINRLIDTIEPEEIYNLAAQSHVAVSFEEPEYTANSDALGALRILEAIRRNNSPIKFYQASTSELFGGQEKRAYDENSIINPRSPYAAAKAYAYFITKQYREAYNIFACNGILFNHESPRRGENFVSKKIVNGIKNLIQGNIQYISLGNLNATRDWGHAKDYVESMWLMMNFANADDWVIATGRNYSIRDFCRIAFEISGVQIDFEGAELNERAIVVNSIHNTLKPGKEVIKVDKRFFRPLEVDNLTGDASKARRLLGWEPKYSLDKLILEMLNEGN
jgi:GDPmannose 4,6-dehydratase